jgi:cytochrome c553
MKKSTLALATLFAFGSIAALAAEVPKSVKIDLSNPGPYFTGEGSDPVNANCTACHSAEMVLAQPALSKAAWQAEVGKMTKVYKASVDEQDIPAIVEYLTKVRGNGS